MIPYEGDRYLDHDEIVGRCRDLAEACPGFVRYEVLGHTCHGRPILLLTLGDRRGDPDARPALWLDAGTHAAEWAGVMGLLYTLTGWVRALLDGDEVLAAWLATHTVYLLPCMSPDGYQAMREGAPLLRSNLRPPRDDRPRNGLEPCDVDGDGAVRWMRWRHPSGTWVFDTENPARMRYRTLDDDPGEAWVVCQEGRLLHHDGVRWTRAALKHGLDLNRNFPASWRPFQMFGQDSGDYPLSAVESRLTVDAFRARPRIAAALTWHTYGGVLLSQPHRADTPLAAVDLDLMERLGRQCVEGTGYRVLRVHPDFVYDPDNPIAGVWADTLCSVFGVPGYTLELWDPFGHAGEHLENPAKFFERPDVAQIGRVLDHFAAGDPEAVTPWRPFDHPELGEVEIGGLAYLTTVRNPPARLLASECARAATVADRMRRALPEVHARVETEPVADGVSRVSVILENRGFLSTAGLRHAEGLGTAPPVTVHLEAGEGTVVDGPASRELGWLEGWGSLQVGAAKHPIYPDLPVDRASRVKTGWTVRGSGAITVRWDAGRGGCGVVEARI